jgi:hypothetical protein
LLVLSFAFDVTARINDVGKNHAGPAKHVIFQDNGVKDRNIVLDLHVVPNPRLTHIDVLPERAIGAYLGGWTDMDPMPDSGSRTDPGARIDDGSWVCEI